MKIEVCNVQINNLSKDEAKKIIEESIIKNKQIKIFTPNPEILVLATKNKKFKEVLNNGDLLIPDGYGIVLLSKIKNKIPGVDFLLSICKIAEKRNLSIFLLGGEGDTAKKTSIKLKEKFPKIKIAGFSQDQNSCYNLIKNTAPDILFVALGAPKQEFWIHENISKFPNIKIAMGVGGAFDMISEKKKRAPYFLRKINLEWLWRFFLEPKKRLKRVFNAIIIFPLLVLYFKFKK